MKISASLSTSLLLYGALLFLLVLSFAGCPAADVNHDPYPVTGDPNPDIVISGTLQPYSLSIAEQGGQKDPDGDIVYFRSETLPPTWTLDSGTGVMEIDSSGRTNNETITFDFWSEDEHGADTSATPFTVTFKFVST